MSYKVQLFSQQFDELGEGVLWHSPRESLFWLDINQSKLYEKKMHSDRISHDAEWFLPEKASSLGRLANDDNSIVMITDKSFGVFNLSTQKYTTVVELPYSADMRSNDGVVAPDGSYWFGSMQKVPSTTKGSIYSVNSKGILQCHYNGIGIPNTFCWIDNEKYLLISDSFKQKQYKFNWFKNQIDTSSKEVFSNYDGSKSTPDGGAVDSKNLIWNALWGGNKLVARDVLGTLVSEIELPVLQPTNCCFGGKDHNILFITSAREGMSAELLRKYPLSGSVFKIEFDYPGQEILPFTLN